MTTKSKILPRVQISLFAHLPPCAILLGSAFPKPCFVLTDSISLASLRIRQHENIERFIQTAEKYVDIEELDAYTLRELVQAIYVEAPDKSSGKRRQNIHIHYDGIGFIPLNELTKQ